MHEIFSMVHHSLWSLCLHPMRSREYESLFSKFYEHDSDVHETIGTKVMHNPRKIK